MVPVSAIHEFIHNKVLKPMQNILFKLLMFSPSKVSEIASLFIDVIFGTLFEKNLLKL